MILILPKGMYILGNQYLTYIDVGVKFQLGAMNLLLNPIKLQSPEHSIFSQHRNHVKFTARGYVIEINVFGETL